MTSSAIVFPAPLRPGDLIRFVSPASTPPRDEVEESAEYLRGLGYAVDLGPNAFNKLNYLAGTDEERVGDLNEALRDPVVRAIFATRGGKGSYRIADRLDFAAARRDPKFLLGFSDITALHLALLRHGAGGSIHGAPRGDERDTTGSGRGPSLTALLTTTTPASIAAQAGEPTSALSNGRSATGPLIGGNLDMVATCAGWALPPLGGAILLLEAVNMFMGQIDRQLTLLRKGGHLAGLAGVAFGQFTDINPSGSWTIVDLLRQHFDPLGIPMLGGLPLGHGQNAESFPLGYATRLDGVAKTLASRMAP
jgi:muramoyltetrapeptide carboxypeptidase